MASQQRVLTMGYDDPRFGGLLAQPLASGGFAGIDWESMFPALAPLIAERRAEYERNANLVAANESMAHLAPMYSVPEGWDQSGLAAEAINRGLITLPELVRQFNERVGGNRLQLLPNGQVAFTQDIESSDPWGALVSGGLMAGVGALSGGFGLQDLINAAGGGAGTFSPDLGAENFFGYDAANPWSGAGTPAVGAGGGGGLIPGLTPQEALTYVQGATDGLDAISRLAEVAGGSADAGASALGFPTADAALQQLVPSLLNAAVNGVPTTTPTTPTTPSTPPTPPKSVMDDIKTASNVVGAATGIGTAIEAANADTSDPYAAIRADEEARQNRIRSSVGDIRSQFGKFDDNYLHGISRSYLDYYLPQLKEQANEARRSLIFSTPAAGTSAFARRSGKLETDIGRQESNIRSQADQQAEAQRAKLANQEETLVSQAEGAGGISDAASRAASMAEIASRPEPYSPLGQLFATYTGNVANAAQAERLGYRPTGIVPNIFSRPGGRSPVVYN